MTFHKLLRIGCGTALGVLAIYRHKSLASPVGAAQAYQAPCFAPNADLTVNPEPCSPETSLRAWDCDWDKKANQKSGALKHIILIRHGHYDATVEDPEKRSLTELGREQAALVGKRLEELCCPFTSIIHSTMPRAKETAEIIATYFPDLSVSSTNILEEGAPLPAEPPVTGTSDNPLRHHADGPRFEAAFRKLFNRSSCNQCKDSFDIVVCHGNVIRYFVCRALQFPPEGFLRMSPTHCSITWLTVAGDGRVVMQCFGESSFMPPGKVTAISPGQ